MTPPVDEPGLVFQALLSAKLLLECDGKRVLMDSLIGILSLDCPRGTRLAVIAEGEDEQQAAETVALMLEGG